MMIRITIRTEKYEKEVKPLGLTSFSMDERKSLFAFVATPFFAVSVPFRERFDQFIARIVDA